MTDKPPEPPQSAEPEGVSPTDEDALYDVFREYRVPGPVRTSSAVQNMAEDLAATRSRLRAAEAERAREAARILHDRRCRCNDGVTCPQDLMLGHYPGCPAAHPTPLPEPPAEGVSDEERDPAHTHFVLDVDGREAIVLGDPAMDDETKDALRGVARAAYRKVQAETQSAEPEMVGYEEIIAAVRAAWPEAFPPSVGDDQCLRAFPGINEAARGPFDALVLTRRRLREAEQRADTERFRAEALEGLVEQTRARAERLEGERDGWKRTAIEWSEAMGRLTASSQEMIDRQRARADAAEQRAEAAATGFRRIDSAVENHLAAMGPCGEADADNDEPVCFNADCTYCALARAAQPGMYPALPEET